MVTTAAVAYEVFKGPDLRQGYCMCSASCDVMDFERRDVCSETVINIPKSRRLKKAEQEQE